jgi:hypothetical protein
VGDHPLLLGSSELIFLFKISLSCFFLHFRCIIFLLDFCWIPGAVEGPKKNEGGKNDRCRSRGPREKSQAFLGGSKRKVGTDSTIRRILKLTGQHVTGKILFQLVPGAGIEPAQPQGPRDFKSLASTNSATQADESGCGISICFLKNSVKGFVLFMAISDNL